MEQPFLVDKDAVGCHRNLGLVPALYSKCKEFFNIDIFVAANGFDSTRHI